MKNYSDDISKSDFDSKTPVPPSLFSSLWRAQVSSLIATVVDFCTLIFCVEVLHLWYVAGTAIGAAVGAVTNFLMGRHWSFKAAHHPPQGQALRYALVSTASLFLNSAGVYFFTETFRIKYWISRLISGLLVGLFFNFTLHRRFVFKHDLRANSNLTHDSSIDQGAGT
jgi:putative flippase GtrA